MPRKNGSGGVWCTKKQKAGNKRRKPSRRNATGTRKLAKTGS